MFTLKIDTSNSAFQAPEPGSPFTSALYASTEVARILRKIADRLDAGAFDRHFQTVHDINGNDVGRFKLTPGGR